ncbi:HET-domain-containing protein [Aspergillus sclerotiicarbonarius CBS 121057]|uniref:HET-domain-containing protein n=1 Tax=Aspergillus sclerotiicarbonarius (strain CBS 121057 / IBT 28362) TaxID=1448318 RepID=A0A319F0F4_ASPSB|nr:HET-domain-containing protein [Aspergillus sclerotiicarbonarius CBS 121057]
MALQEYEKRRGFDMNILRPLPAALVPGSSWSLLEPMMGSDQSLDRIRHWISRCDKHHKNCRATETTTYFPTRIIDVSGLNMGRAVLRNRDEVNPSSKNGEPSIRRPAYWTLSHRWGDQSHILQLVRHKEQEFKCGIHLSELSKTFQDAMALVHRLGYRYIWIDSLCIFQDSPEDWRKESGSMMDIYRQSFCNISAISPSYKASRGLFCERKIPARLLYPFSIEFTRTYDYKPDRFNNQWNMWNAQLWDSEIEDTPLSSRGWVFQERFLAPRVVHFAQSQIYWDCTETIHCEADPDGRLEVLARELGISAYKRWRSGIAMNKGRKQAHTNMSIDH